MERMSRLVENNAQSQHANPAVDANVDVERQVKHSTESLEDDENREHPYRRHIFRWLRRDINDSVSLFQYSLSLVENCRWLY